MVIEPWRVALVEDEEEIRRQVKEFLEGEDLAGLPVSVVAAEFGDALELLRGRKTDFAILDVYQGATELRDQAGLGILESWKSAGFCPVILHTALPEGLDNLKSPFVAVIEKTGDSLQELHRQLEAFCSLKVPQVHRALHGHVKRSVREYMWEFAVENWAELSPFVDQPDFARLILRHVSARIGRKGVSEVVAAVFPEGGEDGDQDPRVHPTEYYLKAVATEHPALGDIREVGEADERRLVVVLWPTCDLVERDGQAKVERALCAKVVRIEEYPEYAAWKNSLPTPSGNQEKNLKKLLENNRGGGQSDRYYFLPGAWDVPASVVDLQALEHLSVAEIKASKCLATLSSPFAEALSSRFVRYVSRLGTPDLDIELVLGRLKS